MTTRPTHATEAGRAYLDLQNLARRNGRPTEELHQLYTLECFLDRLVHSPHADQFILKGGVLLAAYDTRRPTRDVDLSADRIAATPEAILTSVRAIAAHSLDDGAVFETDQAHAETIRDDAEYNGVRVVMPVQLASARMAFHVDVNVGDPIVPPPDLVELPRLRGGVLRLTGYPLAMVHAEKLITMLERGQVNTRWRDFVDVYELLEERIPETFDEILAAIQHFADPVLDSQTIEQSWDPHTRQWHDKAHSPTKLPVSHGLQAV